MKAMYRHPASVTRLFLPARADELLRQAGPRWFHCRVVAFGHHCAPRTTEECTVRTRHAEPMCRALCAAAILPKQSDLAGEHVACAEIGSNPSCRWCRVKSNVDVCLRERIGGNGVLAHGIAQELRVVMSDCVGGRRGRNRARSQEIQPQPVSFFLDVAIQHAQRPVPIDVIVAADKRSKHTRREMIQHV